MTHTSAAAPASSRTLPRASRAQRSKTPMASTFTEKVQITHGTELAAAGIDLLVLRDLMGHASPETTGKYMHRAQLDDIRALQADAEARGWDDEAARHQRVAASLGQHLQRLHCDRSTDLSS
jgi:hypothetical protein